jgi:tRNA A37 threonylcarbamoyladenosine modification protein TsaB
MSYVLVMDSSISGVAVAIQDTSTPNSSSWSGSHLENMGSAKSIGKLVQEGLDSVGISSSDISGICISVGPGSFTGIKVGLSFISGFAAGRDNIVFLKSSGIEQANRVICTKNNESTGRLFLRATRTHGYGTSYTEGALATNLVNATDEKLFVDSVEALEKSKNNITVGEWPHLEKVLTDSGHKVKTITIEEVSKASISGMCQEVGKMFPGGFTKEIPKPNYMRLSTAEEQLGRAVTGRELK